MIIRLVWTPIVCALACLAALSSPVSVAAPVYSYEIVHAYPHDPDAFTEGLFYQDGFLYESTGWYSSASIRRVKLETGEILQRRDVASDYFGEGIVAWKGRLIQLTWRSGSGFVYDLASFKPLSTFHYPGEGWALTEDGHRLIMSDGTPTLRFLDPTTLKETGHLLVTDEGKPVANINELEWVKGEILANIWQTDLIARIDPKSGHVVGWIDLGSLAAQVDRHSADDVLNGIAYDAAHDRLFVTGKRWPKLFEIRLSPKR